jgi:hypothetical protein
MRRSVVRAVSVSTLRSACQQCRSGEMDAKTIVLLVLAGVGGLAVLLCAGMMLLMLPAVRQARTAARSVQSKNNLKQIGLALHNYKDAYNVFPPGGVYAEDGTPQHSWQTMILPFIDQAALYNQIDFNRPWTDPANQHLFRMSLPVFIHPEQVQTVNAQGFGLSHYAGNKQVLFENSSMKIQDITDGISNTMLAGEVAAGFKPWGDPSNVRDPANGVLGDGNTFGGNVPVRGTFQILLTDGSVRDVSTGISPEVMKALATPAGGETVPNF